MLKTNPLLRRISSLYKNSDTLCHFSARLLELNRARVNFKHYGNLPAPEEAQKHTAYVEEALRVAMQDHFAIAMDSLSLTDLVVDPETRGLLKQAEQHIANEEFSAAAIALAKARYQTLDALSLHPWHSFSRLSEADRFVNELSGSFMNPFSQIAESIKETRDLVIMSMLKIPQDDLTFMRTRLPHADRATNGAWRIQDWTARDEMSASECERALIFISNTAIRLQSTK